MALGRTKQRDHSEPPCRLVRFEATDGVGLAGLLYEPRKPRGRALIYLHGTGGSSIFESKRTNLLAETLVARGFAFLPFNNRGAHLIRRLRARRGTSTRDVNGGMAYELIRECVADIDGAIRFLRGRGYTEVYLAGHSTGANKIAVYNERKPRNAVRAYVLLAGGDDVGLMYEQLGGRRFRSALTRARNMIRAGRGEELLPPALYALPMSWRSFYDMSNPDGDYNVFPFLETMRGLKLSRKPRFRQVKKIRKPALAVYGENDEYCFGEVSRCAEILSEQASSNLRFETVVMEEADHGFGGKEEELGTLLADWIESL